MSDPNAWQNVDVTALAQQMLSGMQAMPTYSTKYGYLPPDVAWQQKNLNLQQDMQRSLFDPQAALLAGPGAYDPSAMQSAMEEYQAPTTKGTDYLLNVIAHSPSSPEAVVAKKMLPTEMGGRGMSAQQAIVEAQTEAKSLGVPWPTEADGTPSKSLVKFAEKSWTNLMSDTPGRGTADPYAKAGFSDPSMRFTPDLYRKDRQDDGSLKLDERAKAQRAAMQSMQKQFDAAQKGVDQNNAEVANYPQQLRAMEEHAATGGFNPLEFGAPGSMQINTGMGGTIDLAPQVAPGLLEAFLNKPHASARQSNPLAQKMLQANLGAVRSSNDAWRAGVSATHKANEDTQAYGSPFLMQLAARQAALRNQGVI